MRKGRALSLYLTASHLLACAAPLVLRHRLRRKKEDPQRWREKMGYASAARPDGRLIWLHAVGLGEVLALRALISALSDEAPDLSFLITSSARTSAQVLAANLPPRAIHQFLPLDAPRYMRRFLDHWQPDLSIWSEQDFWPGAIAAAHRRAIPVALINTRMTAQSFEKRRRTQSLYTDVFDLMSFITAQDMASASRLDEMGARHVRIMPSLKPAAAPLSVQPETLAQFQEHLKGREIWLAASTHQGDEAAAIAAAQALPDRLLILAPRDTARSPHIETALRRAGLPFAQRSKQELPTPEHRVWLADSYGEMGLWYRLAPAALIGGGFDAIGGHNPWEAAVLDCAILHGPDISNFAADYAALDQESGAFCVQRGDIPLVLNDAEALQGARHVAANMAAAARTSLAPLAAMLLNVLEGRDAS